MASKTCNDRFTDNCAKWTDRNFRLHVYFRKTN